MTSIQLLTPDDVDRYAAHMQEHARESGTDGDPIFMPYGEDAPFAPGPSMERRRTSWALAVGEPEWARCWGLIDDGVLVGHCEISSMFLVSALHRVGLGMGLLRPYRSQGHGRALLETAINFARGQPFLNWIDLGVFEGNDAAIALYEHHGFVETGRIVDRFRIGDRHVADISMSLDLRRTG
ncbi:MAG: GNAT family N-acetyltransferase [Acidimicrobiia bacterium]|nr:GNAT family N-acetyltransferase [Acidimicrobiia bacterium]